MNKSIGKQFGFWWVSALLLGGCGVHDSGVATDAAQAIGSAVKVSSTDTFVGTSTTHELKSRRRPRVDAPAPAPAPAPSPAPVTPSQSLSNEPGCTSVTAATCAFNRTLGPGINFGNALEAPFEGGYGLSFNPTWVGAVKSAGFTHVRLPVRWSNHASSGNDATLEPNFAARVDFVIEQISSAGLGLVLDMHHYRQFDGDPVEPNEASVQPSVVTARAVNIWRQLAARYVGLYPNMAFELYNEPHGALESTWNGVYPQMIAAIRQTDQSRPVIVGPTWWNAASRLSTFTPPTDPNTIVTVHAYEPHPFTHQFAWGSQWQVATMCCDSAQRDTITNNLDIAKNWSLTHGLPIYVGEFGSYAAAPALSRTSYAGFVRTQLEQRAFAWSYFNFGLLNDWGIYDLSANSWNAQILDALMPTR